MRVFPNLVLPLRPSRWLLGGGVILHLLAGCAVLLAAIPIGVKAGFDVGLILSLAGLVYRYGVQSSRGFIARVDVADGRWRLQMGDGAIQQADLMGGYGHPMLVILNFKLANGRWRSLAVPPDAAEAEALRRLRVGLRIWQVHASSS